MQFVVDIYLLQFRILNLYLLSLQNAERCDLINQYLSAFQIPVLAMSYTSLTPSAGAPR